jgi:hypothetical protein
MRVLHWLSRLVTDDDGQCCWIQEALERGLDDVLRFVLSVARPLSTALHWHSWELRQMQRSQRGDLQQRNNDATITRRLREGLKGPMICSLVPMSHQSCNVYAVKPNFTPTVSFPSLLKSFLKKSFSITYCWKVTWLALCFEFYNFGVVSETCQAGK